MPPSPAPTPTPTRPRGRPRGSRETIALRIDAAARRWLEAQGALYGTGPSEVARRLLEHFARAGRLPADVEKGLAAR